MSQYYQNSSAGPAHHQPQHQLPIAPLPISATGLKRKLVSSISATAVSNSGTQRTKTTTGLMSRRGTAPAIINNPVAPPVATTVLSPCDLWKGLLNEWKVPILDTVGIEQDDVDSNVNFLETTLERIEAYQNIELLTAVRRRDISTLTKIAAEHAAKNTTMNACNRFGESILHLACRKGSVDVVELLVGGLPGCGCSLLVRDDYGRTVLHDACWTINPPWQLIKLILRKAPVLWRVSDVRGHLALQYVPKSAWPQWTAFLTKNKQLLQRVIVHSYHGIDIAQKKNEIERNAGHLEQKDIPTNLSSSEITEHNFPHQERKSRTSESSLSTPASMPVTANVSSESIHSVAKITEPTSSNSGDRAHPSLSAQGSQAAVETRHVAAEKSVSFPMSQASGGLVAKTSATQANAVLANALAQVNPAMLKALSEGEQFCKVEQGVKTFAPVKSVSSQPTSASLAKDLNGTKQTTAPIPAPGPATAALDEALKTQARMRTLHRSTQQTSPPPQPTRKRSTEIPQIQQASVESKPSPLPYAPSISMIAERIAGYKKANTMKETQLDRQELCHNPSSKLEESNVHPLPDIRKVPNPMTAVPNPLLESGDNIVNNQRAEQGMAEVTGRSSINFTTVTTRSKQPSSVPNPMSFVEAKHNPSEDATTEGRANTNDGGTSTNSTVDNSMSSVTMSASPSIVEYQENSSTTSNPTDTESEKVPTAASTDHEEKVNESDGIESGKKSGKRVVG